MTLKIHGHTGRALLCLAGLMAASTAHANGCSLGATPNQFVAKSRDAIGVKDEYIVLLDAAPQTARSTLSANTADQLVRKFRGANPSLAVKHTYERALKGFSLSGITSAQARLIAQEPGVRCVTENTVFRTSGTQYLSSGLDPATGASLHPWGLDRIDQRQVAGQPPVLNLTYNYPATGLGVTVYVVDTGIQTSLGEFGGRASVAANFTSGPHDGCASAINTAHGTKVAGVIGSSSYGVAKNVSLRSVKVADCSGYATGAQVLAGIDWLTANAVRPAIVNMSMNDPTSWVVDDAIQNSIASGLTWVVSAGNYSANACNYSPASSIRTVAVGSIDPDDRLDYLRSNFGACVDLFAPGTGIRTINHLGTATNENGTSFAAAFVSGIAAIFLEQSPGLSPEQLASKIAGYANGQTAFQSGVGSPQRIATLVPPVCELVVGSPVVGAGQNYTFSATATVPGDSVTFWHGTKNGVVDAVGVDSGNPPGSLYWVYNNQPGWAATYTRSLEFRSPSGVPLCITNPVTVQLQ